MYDYNDGMMMLMMLLTIKVGHENQATHQVRSLKIAQRHQGGRVFDQKVDYNFDMVYDMVLVLVLMIKMLMTTMKIL